MDKKFESMGWHVLRINGHEIPEIIDALEEAVNCKGKPVAIIADTVKGKGVSFMENNPAYHGKAPDEEGFKKALEELENG